MSTNKFFQITLRTLDEAAARKFYAAVLNVDAAALDVYPLHENAIARGARPHWLGFLEVDEVDAASAAVHARGGTSYGPKWVNPKGLEAAVLRDPGGALMALAKPAPGPAITQPVVIGHVLNTHSVEAAKKNYAELFGWRFFPPVDIDGQGTFHPFSWLADGDPVGVMGDVAGRPNVHPHWLFQLQVADLAFALKTARAAGAIVAGELTLSNGDVVAVCDDPQGAAFGLRQRR